MISFSLHVLLGGLLWVSQGLDSNGDGTKVIFSSVGLAASQIQIPLGILFFPQGPRCSIAASITCTFLSFLNPDPSGLRPREEQSGENKKDSQRSSSEGHISYEGICGAPESSLEKRVFILSSEDFLCPPVPNTNFVFQ